MENITTTSTTPLNRVRFASPQAADRSLIVGVSGVSGVFYAPMHKTAVVKDVAHFRSRRPPV